MVNELIKRKAARYVEVAATGLRFFPSAAEAIALLAQDRPVAICSGALRAEIEYALNRLNIRKHIQSITSAEDTTRCKPDPQGYTLALERLQADHPDLVPSECLVIEDSLAGVQAARSAGMIPIGITHTYTPVELTEAGAAALIQGLDQITTNWIGKLTLL